MDNFKELEQVIHAIYVELYQYCEDISNQELLEELKHKADIYKDRLKSLESPWVKFSEQLPPANTKILVYAKSSTSTQLQVVDSDLYAGGVLRIAIENNHHWCIPTLPEVKGGDS